jgi:hypothetical protein
MIGTSLAQKVLRAEYSMVRTPLGAIESGLTSRLPARSRFRAAIHRGLANCDAVAARLTRDQSLTHRADLAMRQADTIEHSVSLSDQADELRDAALRRQEEADRAREKRTQAARQERERVARAQREEEKAKQEAESRAAAEAADRKKAAAQRASTRQQQAKKERAAQEHRVAERTQRASAPAKAALKDAAKA